MTVISAKTVIVLLPLKWLELLYVSKLLLAALANCISHRFHGLTKRAVRAAREMIQHGKLSNRRQVKK